MTKLVINFRLGMKYKEFEVDFLGFLLNLRERQFWVRGLDTVFAEVRLGQGRRLS
jgi:hypothetical protein